MAILEKRKSSSPRFKRYQDTKPGDRSDALSGYTSTTRPGGNLMAGTSEDTEGGGADGVRNNADVTSRIAGRTTGVDPSVGAATVARPGNVASNLSGVRAATVPGAKTTTAPGTKTTAATVPGAKSAVTTGTGAKTTGLTSTTLPAVKTTAPPKTTLTSTGSGVKAGTTTGTSGVTGSGVKAGTTTGATTGTTGVKAGTTGVPKLTSTVGNTSLTSTGSGVKTGTTTGTTLPGVKTTTRSNTGSTIGNALTGALTGAALGVGTKAIIDKLTGGTRTTTGGTTTGGTRTTTGGTTAGGTTTGGVKTTTTGGTPAVKPTLKGVPVTSVVKPVTTGPKAGVITGGTGIKAPTGKGAAPIGGGPIKPVAPTKPGAPGTPRGLTSTTDASVDTSSGLLNSDAYDADGNLKEGYALDANGDPYLVGDAADEVVGDGDSISLLDSEAYDAAGNLKEGYDIDANGDPYLVEADDADVDNTEDLDTTEDEDLEITEEEDLGAAAEEDLGDVTEEGPQYFTDDDGNFYDANGEFVMYADGSTYDPEGVAFTDEYGSTYDASGELIEEADHSDFTQQDEEGNTYNWEGELISEADHSDYVSEPDEFGATYDWMGNEVTPGDYSSYLQQDPDGNNFDYYGNFVSFADGTTLADYQDNTYADDNEPYDYTSPYDYGGDYEESLDFDGDGEPGKKGGLFKVGGSNESGVEDTVISEDPIDEVTNEDGTTTQTFADGSVITYDANYNATVDDDNYTRIGDTFTGNIRPVSNSRMMRNFEEYAPGDEIPEVMQRQRQNLEPEDAPIGNTPPEGWPAGFEDNFDGTATAIDPDTGSSVTIDADSNLVYISDNDGNVVFNRDEQAPLYSSAGGWPEGYADNEDGTATRVDEDGSTVTIDSSGDRVDQTGPTKITNVGDSGGIDTTPNKTPAELKAERIAAGRESAETKSALDKILESIGGSGYLGAGAAGAVLGGLLGNSSLFDSGPASTNGFDMSQVGNIDPRTTDFGIGPARYVGYDQYGAPEQMPELYGKELYQNLNAPGFNEVNPGDYAAYDRENEGPYPDQTIPEYSTEPRGYYPMPEYSTEPEYNPDENGGNSLQTFDMADGGEVQPQPGMNTFYTFGKTVDPLENLRNPQPFQPAPPTQQNPGAKPPMGGLGQQMPQQMPQMPQMPPQQMPQQMPQQPMQKPPGLRSGGLPAWSNVPMTQGRLNFRQGASVHGAGDGQSDDIPAMLADGEYVIDADTVAQIGNGSTKAGAAALDKFRENIRSHKRAAPVNQIPPKTRALTSYLKGVK